ncbi:hypothetical protein ACFQJC_01810 [Haloferax namakaokahaiae]|uniref:Uncharacterized protein n=1 Tax=Haloferax namakaokahaiae TaxID=1748331 RepID=A0ABD5ZAJ1_9EURY
MNLLPWLLDWPPRPASILAFLVVTAFSVGSLVLFAPLTDELSTDEVTVEIADSSVKLNDEMDYPEGAESGEAYSCISYGTPGDSLHVRADGTLGLPTGFDRDGDTPYTLEVSVDGLEETRTETFRGTGEDQWDVSWLVQDDETLSVGETTTLRAQVRQSGDVVATTNRSVTIAEGDQRFDCEE